MVLQQDFANQPRSRPSNTRHKRRLMALIALVVSLIAVISLLVLRHHHASTASPLPAPITTNPNKPKHQQNQFEFYSLLSKAKVITSHAPTTRRTGQFSLQASVSKSKNGANALVDELATFGYPAQINTFTTADITYYAVIIGPYLTEISAKKDQSKLSEQHISTILLSPAPTEKQTHT